MTGTVIESTKPLIEMGYRVAQRVIFSADLDLDSLPLYIDKAPSGTGSAMHPDDIQGRRSVQVRAGERVSFGSYFNAFPASYWRRWTTVETVRLSVSTSGSGSLLLYKSNARGAAQRVDKVDIDGAATLTFDLPLGPFGDGGWYWFDVVAGSGAVILEAAEWLVPDGRGQVGRVTLGVTTFNRPDFCLRTIGMIAADGELRSILDELVIIDQGTEKVEAQEGFEELAARLGSQLRIVHQENLGGSGGFSRCMYEAVRAGRSDYVILLDDDIILETESVSRLSAFADMCRHPTIVGGHMFDMNNRSVLHTFGEIVNPFMWNPGLPGPDQRLGHDFARTGLREAPWLHQRVDVDYNGWWMCLIPTSVVQQLGLSLPIFIKWDDAEYGLRAKEAGIPTVSLPGAAVWHVSWIDKDDLVGWQGYFHARNRLITALMYSPFEHGAGMLRTSYFLDLKHLVSMQYYTATGRLMALEDVLAGPHGLHEILPRRLPQIRQMGADFTDARISPDIETFPVVKRRKPIKPAKTKAPLTFNRLVVKGAAAVARQVLAPIDPMAREHPQTRIPHKDNKWYNVARHDSAIVSTADGTGVSWYQRQPKRMRRMAARSSALHGRVLSQWKDLRRQYRDARGEITSFEAWEKTFGIDPTDRV